MKKADGRAFGLAWFGFTLFFAALQYLFNETVNVFAVVLSAITAAPVAYLIALNGRQGPER